MILIVDPSYVTLFYEQKNFQEKPQKIRIFIITLLPTHCLEKS